MKSSNQEIAVDKYDTSKKQQPKLNTMISFDQFQAKQKQLQQAQAQALNKNAPLKEKSRWAKKKQRILGAAGDFRQKLILGFKFGGVIGGTFGSIVGLYYAITYRSLLYVPAFALTSGLSFGFFMSIGMVVRSDTMDQAQAQQQQKKQQQQQQQRQLQQMQIQNAGQFNRYQQK